MGRQLCAVWTVTLVTMGCTAVGGEGSPRERVRAVLREVPLIDGHNDVPWAYRERVQNQLAAIDLAGDTSQLDEPMQTDLARLREGGVGAQFWSVYTPVGTAGPGAARVVLEQIDLVQRLVEKHPEALEIASTADDIVRIHAAGRIASLIGIEGGHCIENSLAVLRQLYATGARYMTLTHSSNTDWADACTDEARFDGLSPFGEEVIREMNRMGMLVDLSHVSADTMHDALDVASAPPIFSHSSARAVCDHVRNVPDDVLVRLKQTDGVVMVTFVQSFVSEDVRRWRNLWVAERTRLQGQYAQDEARWRGELELWSDAHPAPHATLQDVADHIDHVRRVAGIDHVGIGSDFDGMGPGPEGLEDVSKYPDLLEELLRRGYSNSDLAKVCGDNLLRVLQRAEEVAARLQARGPASDMLFELPGGGAE